MFFNGSLPENYKCTNVVGTYVRTYLLCTLYIHIHVCVCCQYSCLLALCREEGRWNCALDNGGLK